MAKILDTHSENTNICENGFKILANVTSGNCMIYVIQMLIHHFFLPITAENKIRAGNPEVIKVILKVLKLNINNTVICENGCTILNKISTFGKLIF